MKLAKARQRGLRWATGVLMTLCALGWTAGCRETRTEGERYTIVTTVGMITDIVREVAGDRAEVNGLIGEGIDPHLYKPTRTDVIALQQADIVFYNGLLLEGRMADVIAGLATRGKPVHAIAEAVLEGGMGVGRDEAQPEDPHLWMDVRSWIGAVEVVARALAAYDPEHADEYTRNAEAYRGRLEELDAYVRKVIGTIPEGKRTLVTAHDAFGYFGRAYGIEVRGVQGLSTESEAGVRDLENLIALIVEQEIPAVFVETSVADRSVRALLEGARARGYELQLGGVLFSDAMGPAGTYEGTYLGMLDHNATVISRSLGGEAPPRGLHGRLSY
jgi:manganese/zinc/iron transport system substrate-binding protein